MKKLIHLTVIFLLGGFIFSSCSSNLSITKRRYTKGYFVQHHPNKKADTKSGTTRSVARQTPAESFAPPLLNEVVPAEVSLKPAQPLLAKAEMAPVKEKQAATRTDNRAVPLEMAIKNPVKALSTAAELTRAADAGDDALSLLWVVIVVILILYLLGLLFDGFGLGNLIHILAVIAVVLLILWLLRLI